MLLILAQQPRQPLACLHGRDVLRIGRRRRRVIHPFGQFLPHIQAAEAAGRHFTCLRSHGCQQIGCPGPAGFVQHLRQPRGAAQCAGLLLRQFVQQSQRCFMQILRGFFVISGIQADARQQTMGRRQAKLRRPHESEQVEQVESREGFDAQSRGRRAAMHQQGRRGAGAARGGIGRELLDPAAFRPPGNAAASHQRRQAGDGRAQGVAHRRYCAAQTMRAIQAMSGTSKLRSG